MKRTIYLHVGMPKTGTTAIQYFLATNRESLKLQGYSYPALMSDIDVDSFGNKLRCYQNYIGQYFSSSVEAKTVDVEDSDKARSLRAKSLMDELFKELDESEEENIILSSESISAFPQIRSKLNSSIESSLSLDDLREQICLEIKESFSDYDVKIVFYTRSPLAFLRSFFLQWSKVHWLDMDFVEYAETEYSVDCRAQEKIYRKVFGESNVHARSYDEKKTSLVDDFCKCVGIENAGLIEKEGLVNPSISPFSGRMYPLFSNLQFKRNTILKALLEYDELKNLSVGNEFPATQEQVEHVVRLLKKRGIDCEDEYEEIKHQGFFNEEDYTAWDVCRYQSYIYNEVINDLHRRVENNRAEIASLRVRSRPLLAILTYCRKIKKRLGLS